MLVDTSVWVDHLRRRNATLVELLEQAQVCTHDFVIGELACGNLAQRQQFLDSLAALPRVPAASHDEVLAFVAPRRSTRRRLARGEVGRVGAAVPARGAAWAAEQRRGAAAAATA